MKVDSLLAKTDFFFILGAGRSGTQMLSGLLNKSRYAMVLHEPNRHDDRNQYIQSRENPDYALGYVAQFRKYQILNRIEIQPPVIYGEVTGTLRYSARALQEVFSNAKFLILVRDGRDVVRSIMGMKTFYRKGSRPFHRIMPLHDDPCYELWANMSRFEKTCWLWANSYSLLLESIPATAVIQLERIVKEYDYFRERILVPLDLSITFEQWQESVKRKSKNATRIYTFPQWKDWSVEYSRSFSKICGEMMTKLGYTNGC